MASIDKAVFVASVARKKDENMPVEPFLSKDWRLTSNIHNRTREKARARVIIPYSL